MSEYHFTQLHNERRTYKAIYRNKEYEPVTERSSWYAAFWSFKKICNDIDISNIEFTIVNVNNKRDKYTVQGKKILLDRPMKVGGKLSKYRTEISLIQ